MMRCYPVMSHYLDSVSLEGVFRTRKDAENFIAKQKDAWKDSTLPRGIRYSIKCHNIMTCEEEE
tara:strand:+ start:416 stop:607 length:192 start_codon:yes stop_codon:yes gene_type:complete